MIEIITRSFLLIFGILLFSSFAIYLIPLMIKYKDYYEEIETNQITYSLQDVIKYCVIQTYNSNDVIIISYFPSTIQKEPYKLICKDNKLYILTRVTRTEVQLPNFVQCNFIWTSGKEKLSLECKKINNTIIINIIR